ncbi:MAG: peptide chain release factor 2 [Kangiellaceae bacterium]|nr:peptide chain release factor 2 [Kangiellaceae bacterium]
MEDLDKETYAPEFWDDSKRAGIITKELASHKRIVKDFNHLNEQWEDLDVLYEFQQLGEESEESVEKAYQKLLKTLDELEFKMTLDKEEDHLSCILTINSGAGGTEANDWSEMLYRMYVMWAEKSNYKISELGRVTGDVAGVKSVTLEIDGEYAFGYLKGENGVHRLVRVSPFNAQGKRQTSFASVFVYPLIDNTIEIDINPADLRVDTFRASGAGGQHVNKTESAIRITHVPSGVVAECQDQRSQHKNKAQALSVLSARILEGQRAVQDKEQAETRKSLVGTGDRSDRIRTYNFPQGRVTDHRINLTLYKLDDFIMGSIDQIIDPLINEYQAEQLAELAEENS